MFRWLKQLFTATPPQPLAPSRSDTRSPPATLGVIDVADAFLQQNPQRTPLGTLALIRAGATGLQNSKEVREACEKIARHGYQYPLSPTVQRELDERHLLDFLRWQEAAGIGKEDYVNEHAVRALIQRFRAEHDA
jgi:hypothetical protein